MRHHAIVAASLIFTMLASLDGYIADSGGNFDWAFPDEEVHRFANDVERDVRIHLYGRRMYDVMQIWDRPDEIAVDRPDYIDDYARTWQAADKVVYSTTLEAASTSNTRVEPTFDAATVRAMKESASGAISIGGPTIAAHAWRAGLVDHCHLFFAPVVVGGGVRALPDGVRADLELVDHRRFSAGFVYVHYRVKPRSAG